MTIAQQLNITEFPFEIKTNAGLPVYTEGQDGRWYRFKYNANGDITRYETSTGYWYTWEYDADGDIIYRETQDGVTYDERNHKAVVLTMDEIAQKLGIDVKDLKIKK
jgi:YD repeat-containing protein